MDGEQPPGAAPRRRAWSALVPVTALCAGLLFATSAATAQGTDLRAGRRSQLTELIADQRRQVDRQEQAAATLRARVTALQGRAAAGNSRVAEERRRGDALAPATGLTELRGPGLRVTLDDAPRADGVAAASDNPDDLVVHQQDLQAVVNALWAGGAEGVTLMGQRLISTSAVRCVGNTVILHGRVYSPPFVVAAVGDVADMRQALREAPGVQLFKTYVEKYGLGYEVRRSDELTLPAYDGPLEMRHVSVDR